MTITKRVLFTISILVTCVSCDQASKSVAQALLYESGTLSFLGDTFRLGLAHNTGAFLSLGASFPDEWRSVLFSGVVGIMLVTLSAYILFAKAISHWELCALSLILAGGAGNLIDRVLFGYVVDFMNIGIGAFRSGIFNVADIAVSAGALMLMLDSFKKRDVVTGILKH